MRRDFLLNLILQIENFCLKHIRAISILIGFFIVSLFFIRGFLFLDPDFGWRLRIGKIILASGIPKTDPFSYTMPSFPYVDHAWLVSTAIGLIYPIGGMFILSIIFTLITILALLTRTLAAKDRNIEKYSLIKGKAWFITSPVFILSASIFLPYFLVRAQVTTWLMLAIVLNIILNRKIYNSIQENHGLKPVDELNADMSSSFRGNPALSERGGCHEKFKFFLPIIFVAWVNLHGGFLSGLTSLFIVIVIKMLRSKKVDIKDLLILFLSGVATLINPYGLGDWREVISSTFDAKLRWSIAEWMPTITIADFSFAAYIALSTFFVFRYRKLFSLEEIILYLFFFIQGISSRRNFPLWVIVSLPMTIDAISFFYQEISNAKEKLFRFMKLYNFFWYISLILLVIESYTNVWSAFIRSPGKASFYPIKGVAYIRENLPEGNIFSNYGWGGYLIWQLPEKKVFIDGRMPSWRFNPPNDSESAFAFDEYNKIRNGETDYKTSFNKYSIDTVFWPNKVEGFNYFLEEKIRNLKIKFGQDKPRYDFIEAIKKDGWIEVYKDETALVLKKE